MNAFRSAGWLVVGVGLVTALGTLACGKSERPTTTEVAGPSSPQLGFSQGKQRSESAPIALTTSDGAGLVLVSVEARTVIEDPLAFTELHLKFHNPEPRRREGRFSIALPPAAAISRFAMRVGSELQEGEVVERLRAQQVYEDFLHRKQDPALLEKAAGNEFSARVFPIEASADKEIIVAYSEELAQRDEPYRLLLGGLPQLSQLRVEVLLGSNSATGLESSEQRKGVTRLTLEKRDFTPGTDLELRLPWQKPFALRSGNLVVARVKPVPISAPQAIDGLTVLFDTSASRALGYAAQIERLGELLAELARQKGKGFELRVVAFDQDSEELYRGAASDFGLRDKGRLLAREALGATDLHQALSFLAQKPDGHARLLLISDGMVTAGEEDVTRLREDIARLSAHGVARLDVLAEGGVNDQAALAELTHAGLKTAGVVLSARAELPEIGRRLLREARDRVEVHVAGASWVHPSVLEGVQAGDERLVFAELPADAPVQIELSGAGNQALPTLEAPAPLLQRAFARAKIEALTTTLKGSAHLSAEQRAEREREIVQLSMGQRVLSDYTALLVLESERDYRRFGIEQNALTSILHVGVEGIELLDRKAKGGVQQIARERGLSDRERELLDMSLGGRAAPGSAGEPVPSEGLALEERADERPSDRQQQPERRARAEVTDDKASERDGIGRLAARSGGGAAPRPAPPAPSMAPASAAPAAPSRPEPAKKVTSSQGAPSADMAMDQASASALTRLGHTPDMPREVLEERPAQLEPRATLSLHSAIGVPQAQAASVWRSLASRARACYARAEQRGQDSERLFIELSLSERGSVRDGYVTSGRLADGRAQACILAAAQQLQFPKPEAGSGSIQGGVELSMVAAASVPSRPSIAAARPRPRPRLSSAIAQPNIGDAYDGDLATVLTALRAGDTGSALALARAAHERDPADVLALVALGEALEARHELPRAARVYGSLIDLFPSRADLRRMAGERLERLSTTGLTLAIDSYQKAAAQRPDHPSSHRLLGYALLKQGQRAGAFAALERALDQSYPSGRFAGVDRILREDLSLIGAAWLRAEPDQSAHIAQALAQRGLKVDSTPSLRFVLNWETDANDVDFHIYDGRGGHASYMQPRLGSGGALYADVTTGYGPECFAMTGGARAYPYVLQAHYFARGPMGYGMGKLQVIEHDGKGGLKFREQPFVIMKDKAFVELLRMEAPLG